MAKFGATLAKVARPRTLPSVDEVWAGVRAFAERRRVSGKPVHTLARYVGNIITHVDESKIQRHSAEGTKQTAHITRRHVEGVWQQLLEHGRAVTTGHDRVLTHALMLHALPQWIRYVDQRTIGLRGRELRLTLPLPSYAAEEISYDPRPGRSRGGEGPLHRALRLYIFEQPDEALANLRGGPWNVCGTEHVLETQDRIDVVVRDSDGNYTLIEVKPEIVSDTQWREIEDRLRPCAIAPFAQAAKYRAQWHMLYDTPIEHIRCVVAAPTIPITTLSRKMLKTHKVESVAVTLPPDRRPTSR